MKGKVIFTILTVLSWIAVMIPAVNVLKECMDSFINGTVHGFHGEEVFYGFPAFMDTFLMLAAFLLPFFILWGVMLVVAIILTIITIILYVRKSGKKEPSQA